MCVIQGDDQIVESSSTVNSVGTGSVNNTEQQPCPKEQIPGSNETRCIPGSKSGLAGSEFGEDGNVKMSLKCITYHGSQPTQQPTAPTNTPTKGPTNGPTNTPTQSPTAEPTKAPTVNKIKTEFKPPSHWCKGDQYADPLPETSGYASFTNTTDIQCLAICKQYNDQLYQWKGLWGAAPHWDGVVPFTTNVKIPGGNVNQYMNQMDETVTVEGPKWKNWVNFPEGTPCLRVANYYNNRNKSRRRNHGGVTCVIGGTKWSPSASSQGSSVKCKKGYRMFWVVKDQEDHKDKCTGCRRRAPTPPPTKPVTEAPNPTPSPTPEITSAAYTPGAELVFSHAS